MWPSGIVLPCLKVLGVVPRTGLSGLGVILNFLIALPGLIYFLKEDDSHKS